jgi:hypothetical protein
MDCGVKNSPPRRASLSANSVRRVLMDEPKSISGDQSRKWREKANEFNQDFLLELLIPARKDSLETAVRRLDRIHYVV